MIRIPIALLAMSLAAGCSGAGGDGRSTSSPSPAPPDDEDTSIAEAIPVSFHDKNFLATVGSLFDLVIDKNASETPEPLVAEESDGPARPFDYATTKNISQFFLAQYRARLDKISSGLSQLLGDGGPFAADGKAKIRISGGKGAGLFKTTLDGKDVLVEVRIDRSSPEPQQIDIYALGDGDPVWSFGVRVLAAEGGKAPDVRYLGRTMPEGGKPGGDFHLNEFTLRPAHGEVLLARSRATAQPPKAPERRSFTLFRFDDDTLTVVAALQVDSGKTPARIPGLADFLVAYDGNAVLHEIVVARKGAPLSVQRSAFLDQATITATGGKLPVATFLTNPLSRYGAIALAETLGAQKRFPGCINLGTRLTDAFKALTPGAAVQPRYDDATPIAEGGPASFCSQTTPQAKTLKHLDTICAFEGVLVKLGGSEPATQGLDVCKEGWGSAVAGLRNPLVFDVKDNVRVQRLVRDGFYSSDLLDGEHAALAAKFQASGTIDLPRLVEGKVLFEVPSAAALDAAKATAL